MNSPLPNQFELTQADTSRDSLLNAGSIKSQNAPHLQALSYPATSSVNAENAILRQIADKKIQINMLEQQISALHSQLVALRGP